MADIAIVLGTVFTAFGTILVGFYKFAESRESQFDKNAKETSALFAEVIEKLGNHIDKSTAAQQEVAKATTQAAKEAAERNGHLGEQNIQITELIAGQNKDISEVLTTLKQSAATLAVNTEATKTATKDVAKTLQDSLTTQVIDNQTVVHQTVRSKE